MNLHRLTLPLVLAIAIVLAGSIVSSHAASATFEAESGVLGSNFTHGASGAVQFISISTDRISSSSPGSTKRVAAYTVTFPAAGTYNHFARVLVGSGSYNRDSLLHEKQCVNQVTRLAARKI